MDKVQIYYTATMILGCFTYGVKLGTAKESKEVAVALIALAITAVVSLPVMGRIYGWW